jgi:RHS repeat-associated protein
VIHTKGPLLEETHYYPFGLTMAGISSKALKGLTYLGNRKKYNGIDFESDLGIDIYDAEFRELDPQIGKWWQIDPMVEYDQESLSPYCSMNNNPVSMSDPAGDLAEYSQADFSETSESACCGEAAIARAASTWGNTQRVAGTVIVAGGGPEDILADGVAVITEVVGGIISLWELLSDDDVVAPKPAQKEKTETAPTPPVTPPVVQAKQKKGPKDLVKEAQEQKQKEAEAAERLAKRQQATTKGKTKVGQSNQTVKGEHNSGGNNLQKHQKANARRLRDQKMAEKNPNNRPQPKPKEPKLPTEKKE